MQYTNNFGSSIDTLRYIYMYTITSKMRSTYIQKLQLPLKLGGRAREISE